jgi:type II secretory pathway pseudopilin PulG
MVALVAGITVMMIMTTASLPFWRYVIKQEREEELLFRGNAIARAVFQFQQKNGNAAPPSLDVLVKGKFLRKAYKDPMTREGKWRFLRPGETLGPALPPGMTGLSQMSSAPPNAAPTGPGGQVFGGIFGVASTSTDKSLKVIGGRSRYNDWLFLAGQPPLIPGPINAFGPGAPGLAPGQNPQQQQQQPRPGGPGFQPSPFPRSGPGQTRGPQRPPPFPDN